MKMRIKDRLNRENLSRGASYIKRNGVVPSFYKAYERLIRDEDEKDYMKTSDVFDEIAGREQRELEENRKFTHNYRISIIVPAYETDPEYFREMALSVITQTYTNWELVIADASESDKVKFVVDAIRKEFGERASETKLKYIRLTENKGISGNTNEALKVATGEYVGLLDHDDVLTENALYEVMEVLESGLINKGLSYENNIKVIYSDEDKVNSDMSKFFDYHKKPDFDIDLLRTNNYICHFFVVRKELADEVNGFNPEFDGSQDHDFILRCVERLERSQIKHIDKVLYHWRSHINSTATNPDSKLYAYEAGKKAVMAHLDRLGIKAEVTDTLHLGFYRVKYHVSASELTDIKIMSLDELKALNYDEIKEIEESYILILNDNVKPKNPEFIEEFLGHLKRPEVGCVGGLVISKNGKIESAGYKKDGDTMIPEFAGLNRHFSGYLHRAKLQRMVDGVCTDCMMIKKSALTEDKKMSPDYIVVYTPYSVFKRA